MLKYLRAVNHELYMRRCLELAGLSEGRTSPNPMVGAVLVHGDRIIGEGRHEQYGLAHAEVNCFESVPGDLKHLIPDSVLYVSLEPCAHYGKTPPCAERIIREGVRTVVIANRDPFEKVGGRGIALLEAAGVAVTTGILEAEGRWLNRRFFCTHEQQRPYVLLKWACSADGYLAPFDRSRRQLSNPASQRLAHRWRTEESAILVGSTTALKDNPRLTARMWDGPNPLRIVLDRKLQLPPDLHLFNREADTWIVNTEREERRGHLQYVQLPFDEALPSALLQRLYEAGRLSLMVEGGAQLLNTFIGQGLWDEARIFQTPVALGQGLPAPVLLHAQLQRCHLLAGDVLEHWLHRDAAFKPASES